MKLHKGKYGNFEWIPGHLNGIDVFVIGSGYSLHGFDFCRLNGAQKIVISHTSRFVDPDYLVFLDPPVMNSIGKEFDNRPYKTVIGPNVNLEPKGNLCKVNYSHEPQLDPRSGFYGARSSGWFALNLAVAMRAKTIYLLGHDCRSGPKETGNFYNTQQVKGYRRSVPGRYESMAGGYEKFKRFTNIVNVINHDHPSAVKCFKTITLQELFG